MSLAQPASLVFILLSMALATPSAWRGNERTRIFLLAFGLYGLGLAVSLARNQGWIAPGLVRDNSYAIGALAQALCRQAPGGGRGLPFELNVQAGAAGASQSYNT